VELKNKYIIMKEEILNHLNETDYLEKMYRSNKSQFKREFNELYPSIKESSLAGFWNERLNYEGDEISWGKKDDLIFVLIASVIAGIVAKMPAILNISEDFYYPRNIGFVIFPVLSVYFAWKNGFSLKKGAAVISLMILGVVFINLLPDVKTSDTLILSCIHLALFLWALLGFSYVGTMTRSDDKRMSFLKYNGDLIVMTTLIVIAGLILSGVTVGLFGLIGFNIEKFFFSNIWVVGLAASPIIGTYLIRTNPQLVGKVSPVIAKIFSPLVLVMLVIYIVAIAISGKDPYNDRQFLMLFNALLIGVMAIIFFSLTTTSHSKESKAQSWVLFLLSAVTLIVNIIALSAIIFRISQWGISPNRAAVIGSNLLFFVNLLIITFKLFKVIAKKQEINVVGQVIARYLPYYVIWTIIVAFLFPVIFNFI
jgi:hypothetical protein